MMASDVKEFDECMGELEFCCNFSPCKEPPVEGLDGQ
jgi:hypothetical protein